MSLRAPASIQAETRPSLGVSGPGDATLLVEWGAADKHVCDLRARYAEVVQHLPLVTYIATAGGELCYRYISPRIQDLTGHAPAAWLLQPGFRRWMVHPDDSAQAHAIESRALLEGTGFVQEYRLRTADGGYIWVQDHADIVLHAGGGPPTWHGYLLDITERKETELRLRATEFKHRSLVEENPVVIYSEAFPSDLGDLYIGPRIEELCGYSREEWLSNVGTWESLIHPDDRDRVLAADAHADATGEPFRMEYRWIHRDGRVVWIQDECVLVRDDLGTPICWQGVFIDITERKRIEEALRDAESRYRRLVEQLPAIVYTEDVSAGRPLTYISSQVQEMFGDTPEAWITTPDAWRERLHPLDRERVIAERERAYAALESYASEYRLRARDGRYVWVHDEARIVRDDAGQPAYWQGIAIDISASKALEEELAWRAYHDPLTDLPNRGLFLDRLRVACTALEEQLTQVAVLFLDLDNLKVVNDSLGHSAGDQILQAVTGRLRPSIRSDATLARLGGDEFTVLLPSVTGIDDALKDVHAIERAFRPPFYIDGREIFLSASIGIAMSTPNLTLPDDLLRDADIAMYRAKAAGKARYEVFDPSMNALALERLEIESDLRRALDRGELEIVYQPTVHLDTGRTIAMEALVRWQHPTRGTLFPADFIPIAEETGLIVTLGRWVLHQVCRQAQQWRTAIPGLPIVASVNLSGRQFQQRDLVTDVVDALAGSGLPAQALALEITESVVMDDVESTVATLRALKHVGVQIGIDDFGTGYSSLAYLRRFPVDFLKIDQTFVADLEDDTDAKVIVTAMIGLAHALGLTVVAEGIETAGQLRLLADAGCDIGQGFLFSVPVTPERCFRNRFDMVAAD